MAKKWPGSTWLEHTCEMAGVVFIAALYSAWQHAPGWFDLDWHRALSDGSYQAVGAVLYAVVSLAVKNGTASLNPRVVAQRKPATLPGPSK